MQYTLHTEQQGSAEWLAGRNSRLNASELALAAGETMNGRTRSDLIRKLATGIEPEVDAFTQKRLDDGHRFEALARPLAEKIIGSMLYAITVSIGVPGLKRRIGASLDGATMGDETNFEHKGLNAELSAALDNGVIPSEYHWQMEQGQATNGATRTLFMASKWEKAPGEDEEPGRTYGMAKDENGELCRYALVAEKHCWYESNPELRAKIVPTWKQLEADVENYQHVEIAERPKPDVVIDLPALFVHAKGEITTHNMDEFGIALAARLAETRAIVLVTDQDFSNAKNAAKKFRETAKAVVLSKTQMLAQTETVGEAARKMDAWAKDLNETALQLEKDVAREDNAKKEAMVLSGKSAYAEHVAALEIEIAPIRLGLATPNFAEAIKGKSKYTSMQDAVDTMLARAKIEADAVAKDVRAKLAWCKENASEHSALLPDLQQIISKPMDDFTLTITSRIDKAKVEEEKRLDAEREKIRAEEEAKAAAKVKAEQEESARPVAEVAPTLGQVLHAAAPTEVASIIAPSNTDANLKLGEINARIAPLSITAEGMRQLGFEPHQSGAAKVFRECDYTAIIEAMIERLREASPQRSRRAA